MNPTSGVPAAVSDRLDWNDLRDVLAVAEAGSLSAAAREMGVSQSTMSRRIAAIEAGGRPVFDRSADGRLIPTARGTAMLEVARAMRDSYRSLLAALAPDIAPLRIASCEVTARLFLSGALPDWSAQGGPAADHAVYDDLFALPSGAYDIMVTPADSLPEGTTGLRLGNLDWAAFAAPSYLAGHPVRSGANSLVGHRVIRASGSLARIPAYAAFEALGGEVALLSSSPIAQMEACALGQGIALLPRRLAKGDARLAALDLPVPDPSPVWIIADAREASHPRLAGFLRWARRHFGAARPQQVSG